MTTSHQKEQAERKALAGSTTTMTFHSRALADLQLEQGQSGRFTDKASLSGAEASVRYPKQPATSPWSSDLSGVEPPLGVDLGYVEPCGTPKEVEESLLREAASSTGTSDAADAAQEVGHSASVRPAPPALIPLAAGGASSGLFGGPNAAAGHSGAAPVVQGDDAATGANFIRRGRKL
jgi:hypothetical protein